MSILLISHWETQSWRWLVEIGRVGLDSLSALWIEGEGVVKSQTVHPNGGSEAIDLRLLGAFILKNKDI